jgi:hypothetical protein
VDCTPRGDERAWTDAFYERQYDYLASRLQVLRQATAADVSYLARLPVAAPDRYTFLERRRLTLLHQAVASASLGAAAVLLRAGADPLRQPDDAPQRRNAANSCGSSAL